MESVRIQGVSVETEVGPVSSLYSIFEDETTVKYFSISPWITLWGPFCGPSWS